MISKKYVKIFLFCAVICLGTSCTKKTQVTGLVLDIYSGKGIPDIQVTLHETQVSLSNVHTSGTWETFSGADGSFIINYSGQRKKNYSYSIAVQSTTDVDTAVMFKKEFIHFLNRDEST